MAKVHRYQPQQSLGPEQIEALIEENALLRQEIRVARQAADITAELVVKQFEETERVLERLHESNVLRKTVLNSATQIAIIATNMYRVITVFNTGAENLLGYRASEVVGHWTPEIFHVDAEIEQHNRQMGAEAQVDFYGLDCFLYMANQGYRDQREWTYVKKDGTLVPVEMSVNALREADGQMSGFLCIAMDVTEKKESQRALKESERNYRLLIKNIPNVVFKGYADGTIDFFDDKVEAMTGYPKEAFLSRKIKWPDLIIEEDRELARQRFIQALRTNKSYIREYRIRKRNGDMVWVEAGAQIICDNQGQIEFITGAFLNITERKQAEQALHFSEVKYRSLFNSGPNPIFVLDRHNLEILDANPMAEETYGYKRHELIGRSFSEIGPLAFDDESKLAILDPSAYTHGLISEKVRHYKKGKQPIFVKLKTSPTRIRDKKALIVAATDITEMVEKDALLIQACKMTSLGEMSAGMAHELNQPLNAIKMGSEYITMMVDQKRQIPEAAMTQVFHEISEQVDRASNIINHLRAFGRKSDLEKQACNINDPIENVARIIGRQLQLEGIALKLDLAPSLQCVYAHQNRLEQVFFNLITNARDAIISKADRRRCESDGEIRIQTAYLDFNIVVRITDNGIGIPEARLEKIYEPFYTTKDVGKGMGLGLSIIYGIVQDHGGRIAVRSKPDEGTTFVLRFPAVIQEDPKQDL